MNRAAIGIAIGVCIVSALATTAVVADSRFHALLGIGAGAGLIAVIATAAAVRRKLQTRKTAVWALCILVFAATSYVSHTMAKAMLEAAEIEKVLLETPDIRAIKLHAPAAYQEILDVHLNHNYDFRAVVMNGRTMVNVVTTQKLPNASNAVLLSLASYVVEAASHLDAQGKTQCLPFTKREPNKPVDFYVLIDPMRSEQDRERIAQIITSAAGAARPAIDVAAAQADKQEAMAVLASTAPVGFDFNGAENQCRITAALFAHAIDLSAPRNTRLIRYLLAGSME